MGDLCFNPSVQGVSWQKVRTCVCESVKGGAAVAALSAALIMAPSDTFAISGGGKDYASKDWTGTDFSKGSFVGKDFSGSIARGTHFESADLRGARFFKSDLREADFSAANLSAASLEGCSLRDAVFTNADLQNAYFSESILEARDFKNVDFTDALMPEFVIPKLCNRSDVTGTNPKTGVDTRESLMCP
mmetsp:Transcript_4335/g.13111  ORF Transcript_4335/g.13111 Transcript_4335/m.13111 type:complete len:189 (-) Transcript_4335:905-1471(-)|eukprot:CAMPEP_0198723336 /NCGR_PEP_ID=MMETSP1475-20131203/858_1 /TAXON_ID= ORGANISM="Unidentified sp., Strain CCMP1999" /NCGR_SAMPLE_ID=MMETSP1475 /ASSEMBLY_ACC=CAM_ASM_001111 /LENGTH=188 /DNA_ID=CAMNT_0044484429 /DNA_START=142 /DNA_END=708 /DNA_ORIENTATION=+